MRQPDQPTVRQIEPYVRAIEFPAITLRDTAWEFKILGTRTADQCSQLTRGSPTPYLTSGSRKRDNDSRSRRLKDDSDDLRHALVHD